MNENSKVTVAELEKYDIKVAIDKSGSMGEKDMPGGVSRWKAAEEATVALVRKAAEFDKDGVTIAVFGNGKFKIYDNVADADKQVANIFKENEPNGGTPTAEVLKALLDEYFEAKAKGSNPKPIIIAVVTDGEPDDKAKLAKVITDASHKMETDDEVGITFIQIAENPGATAFLKSLDDDLKDAKFDIVDTINLKDVESIAEVLVNSLND